LASWRSLTKRAGSGSGSVSQRNGSEDPDPHLDPYQNVTDPEHCCKQTYLGNVWLWWDEVAKSGHGSLTVQHSLVHIDVQHLTIRLDIIDKDLIPISSGWNQMSEEKKHKIHTQKLFGLFTKSRFRESVSDNHPEMQKYICKELRHFRNPNFLSSLKFPYKCSVHVMNEILASAWNFKDFKWKQPHIVSSS
jgi:hypothetical protein